MNIQIARDVLVIAGFFYLIEIICRIAVYFIEKFKEGRTTTIKVSCGTENLKVGTKLYGWDPRKRKVVGDEIIAIKGNTLTMKRIKE